MPASTNQGACRLEDSHGQHAASPFNGSAGIPNPIPLRPDGSYGFNFPGSTAFNGQGQVTASGGWTGVGIGNGPNAAGPGGFIICASLAHITLH